MSKVYKYKGYEFWRTNITTDKTYKANDGFYKTKGHISIRLAFNLVTSFLTTIEDCKRASMN